MDSPPKYRSAFLVLRLHSNLTGILELDKTVRDSECFFTEDNMVNAVAFSTKVEVAGEAAAANLADGSKARS